MLQARGARLEARGAGDTLAVDGTGRLAAFGARREIWVVDLDFPWEACRVRYDFLRGLVAKCHRSRVVDVTSSTLLRRHDAISRAPLRHPTSSLFCRCSKRPSCRRRPPSSGSHATGTVRDARSRA